MKRAGHTEASVDLAILSGLPPVAILCEIVDDDDGSMARLPKLREFAKKENLKIVSIADLIRFILHFYPQYAKRICFLRILLFMFAIYLTCKYDWNRKHTHIHVDKPKDSIFEIESVWHHMNVIVKEVFTIF